MGGNSRQMPIVCMNFFVLQSLVTVSVMIKINIDCHHVNRLSSLNFKGLMHKLVSFKV